MVVSFLRAGARSCLDASTVSAVEKAFVRNCENRTENRLAEHRHVCRTKWNLRQEMLYGITVLSTQQYESQRKGQSDVGCEEKLLTHLPLLSLMPPSTAMGCGDRSQAMGTVRVTSAT